MSTCSYFVWPVPLVKGFWESIFSCVYLFFIFVKQSDVFKCVDLCLGLQLNSIYQYISLYANTMLFLLLKLCITYWNIDNDSYSSSLITQCINYPEGFCVCLCVVEVFFFFLILWRIMLEFWWSLHWIFSFDGMDIIIVTEQAHGQCPSSHILVSSISLSSLWKV